MNQVQRGWVFQGTKRKVNENKGGGGEKKVKVRKVREVWKIKGGVQSRGNKKGGGQLNKGSKAENVGQIPKVKSHQGGAPSREVV